MYRDQTRYTTYVLEFRSDVNHNFGRAKRKKREVGGERKKMVRVVMMQM